MRLIRLSALTLVLLAACGEQKPAEAPVTPAAPAEVAAPEAPADPADANAMTPDEIAARLVGSFRSLQDDKVTLTVVANGAWTETYEGSVPQVSSWRVFAGTSPPEGSTETVTPASRYLELTGDDGVFLYEMGRVDAAGFDMFYMPRGNNLRYERVARPG
jgi:hypothetical protein